MTKLINWIKDNKLSTVLLLLVVGYILSQNFMGSPGLPVPLTTMMRSEESVGSMGMTAPGIAMDAKESDIRMGKPVMPPFYDPVAPQADVSARMVVRDTNVSLKVDDVESTVSKIESTATQVGGYLVDSNVSLPETAGNGSITIRVPSDKRTEALTTIKSFGVKVVSEFVSGQDVTDQFVDNEERLRILETTKTKFEAILSQANTVSEMLNVQRELLSIQQQIDGIKGQQAYLEGTTKLSRITVYLSTDELSLPYAPDNSWRPGVVFKEAVRSLILNLRGIASLAIWILVFSPVWIAGIVILTVIKRKFFTSST